MALVSALARASTRAMPIIDRLRASAISWGDSLLPPGPLRTRITDMARARGVTFAPSSHGVPDELQARHVVFDEASIEQLLVALKEDYFGAQTEEFGDVEEYLARHREGRLPRSSCRT